MTQHVALVDRRHIRSGIAIRLGLGILVAWLGCACVSPSAVNATPVPPPTFEGRVLQPSAAGLAPVANVVVQSLVCFDLSTCLTPPESLQFQQQTTTASDGSFRLSFFQYLYSPEAGVLRTQIDGIELRAVVDCSFRDPYDISPISEATARLLATRAVRSYGACGIATIAEKVANANRDTDFSGLSVADAIAVALAVAQQDPTVLQALLTPTPTPTRTDTPTPSSTPTTTATATHTFRATATPQPCAGDCNGDGNVTVDELLQGVDIALGNARLNVCPSMDDNDDGRVSVDDLIAAANVALAGCALPDLSIVYVQAIRPPGCGLTDEVVVEVCVANLGDFDSASFEVSLDQGREIFTVPPLHAGEEHCSLHQLVLDHMAVDIDPDNLIVESNEQNNSAVVTLSDPPPRTTCTPTLTPTRAPTPTPT